eukprot:3174830-Heterocapsa_arctica.AAC.1
MMPLIMPLIIPLIMPLIIAPLIASARVACPQLRCCFAGGRPGVPCRGPLAAIAANSSSLRFAFSGSPMPSPSSPIARIAARAWVGDTVAGDVGAHPGSTSHAPC